MKLAPHPGVGSRDGCFNFRRAREQLRWYGGCLAPLHTLPAWREDEVIAAGLLAPGFQLSARAETAVAEALARDQPHTLQPFLARCYTGALAAGVGIVRWWWGEEGKNWEKLLGAATPIMCGGARAA